jgi:hypothetical protein
MLLIPIKPLGLDIGGMGPELIHTRIAARQHPHRVIVRIFVSQEYRPLIITEPEVAQELNCVLKRSGDKTLLVGILDAQDKLPAELARVEIVVEGGPEATDMLQACRRWCITHPNRLGFRV